MCEKWVTMDNTFHGRRANGTYNATFYFPVNQWQVGRQDYHRLLKEVRIVGLSDDGDDFEARFVCPSSHAPFLCGVCVSVYVCGAVLGARVRVRASGFWMSCWYAYMRRRGCAVFRVRVGPNVWGA